jgi:formate transporter
MDALLPPDMAQRAETIGVSKARLDPVAMLVLAVLAGAFIALGGLFSTTVVAGAAGVLPFGLIRLLAGVAFSLGLILVVVGGAELFTGNNLIVMAWASRKVSTGLLLRNWAIVYSGNFVGAAATAALVFLSGQYQFGHGSIGLAALSTAEAKLSLGFFQAICLGMLCNVLVCLAVWLSYSARTTADRILAVVPPVTAFVAAGFEHSVANMYFLPVALLIQSGAPDAFWTSAGTTADAFSGITWRAFLFQNLLPVTIGNIIGGAAMVGGVYWFVYLRPRRVATGSGGAIDATLPHSDGLHSELAETLSRNSTR